MSRCFTQALHIEYTSYIFLSWSPPPILQELHHWNGKGVRLPWFTLKRCLVQRHEKYGNQGIIRNHSWIASPNAHISIWVFFCTLQYDGSFWHFHLSSFWSWNMKTEGVENWNGHGCHRPVGFSHLLTLFGAILLTIQIVGINAITARNADWKQYSRLSEPIHQVIYVDVWVSQNLLNME